MGSRAEEQQKGQQQAGRASQPLSPWHGLPVVGVEGLGAEWVSAWSGARKGLDRSRCKISKAASSLTYGLRHIPIDLPFQSGSSRPRLSPTPNRSTIGFSRQRCP